MSVFRGLLTGATFMLLLANIGIAQSTRSASAGDANGSAGLDWVESEAVMLEKAAAEGARDFAASLSAADSASSPHVGRALAHLDSLLRADSTNVRASILYARLGLAAVLCTPIRFNGTEPMEEALPVSARDLDRALDRALLKEPNNPEVYYWKGTVSAAPIDRARRPMSTRSSLDFEGAVRAMRRAVELAPDSLEYREALASQLLDLDRPDEARETMRPAQGGQHPLYRLLTDWTRIPHPPNSTPAAARPWRSDAWQAAARHGFADWTSARVDAFVVPWRLKELEAFYGRLFPGFKFYLLSKESGDGASLRYLVGRLLWNGQSLTAAANRDDATRDETSNSIVLTAGEITHPAPETRNRFGVPTADVFCVVTLTNFRGLQSPDAAASALGLSGTYEASPDDDRATLEFMDGRKVRLSVSFSGAEPSILEGEYTVEGDGLAVTFFGAPRGKPAVLEVRINGATLVASIPRDERSGRIFFFTKK